MQNRLNALGAAGKSSGTAGHRLAAFPHGRRTAYRAKQWHGKWLRRRRPLLENNAENFRNHVTGTANDYRIANAQPPFALDFICIMQGGVGHRDAANEHGREARHRRQRTGTTDLDVDRLDHGQRLLRWVFVRHRPARFA